MFANLKKYKSFIEKHWFAIASIVVLVLTTFLRFYKYSDRWGLAFDQAHDAILAQYALTTHQLPLLGPFSSAGAFQTGGEWYWFIMLGKILFPFSLLGPWILLTIIQIIFVGLMIYLGKIIGGRMLGVVAGLLAAVSPVEIAQAINLTNQSLLNISAVLLLIFAILYLKSKKNIYLFLMGIFTTLGATIHLQGVPLFIFSFLVLVFGRVKNIKGLALFVLGALLPVASLMYVDYLHKWFNVKNMVQYYFHDQYKISLESLGRRWTTYLDSNWPTIWGNILGSKILGYIFISASILLLIFNLIKKKLFLSWTIVITTFLIIVYMLKNLRVPVFFDSYIMFLHPFIFLFSAAVLVFFIRKNLFIGLLLVLLVVGIGIQKDAVDIKNARNWSAIRASGWEKILETKYPGKKFALYDYRFRSTTESGPLVMYLQYANLLDDKGYKIGFGLPSRRDSVYADYYSSMEIKNNPYGFNLVDINSSTSAELAKEQWGPINPSYMYNAQENWYK